MNRSLLIGAGAAGIAIGAIVLFGPAERDAPRLEAPALEGTATPEAARARGPSRPNTAPPTRRELLEAGAAYEAEFGLGARVGAFADEGPSLSRAERDRRAEALLDQIDAAEADGRLVAAQGPYLRAAVARTRFSDDPAALEAAIAALKASAAEKPPAAIDHGPAFAAYKRREAEIIAEVQGRESFPGGLSRSEYLRRELEAARREAYGE